MDKHSAQLLRIVTGALRREGIRQPSEVAQIALGALADHCFEGATATEIRADLRMLRAEGLDGPAELLGGLLGFGDRDRGADRSAHRRGEADDDDQAEDDDDLADDDDQAEDDDDLADDDDQAEDDEDGERAFPVFVR